MTESQVLLWFGIMIPVTVLALAFWIAMNTEDPREIMNRWQEEQDRVGAQRATFAAIRERINRGRVR